MKKYLMMAALAIFTMSANVYSQDYTRNGNNIEFAKEERKAPVRKTTIDDGDRKTGLTMSYGGKTYNIYLNKNNKAFILAEKKDGTGTYIKWLGPEKTAAILKEMNK